MPMHLKVVLPSGEVNVPVEPNSTPGHLKENLKYSIRVPPKLIRLTCEGRELDDIKPLVGEPNNLTEGSVIIAEAKEGSLEDASAPKASEGSKPASQPTVIKKEEPPKPKKTKKDVVRPTVGEGDVVKKEVLAPGYEAWTPKYIEGKQPKRHLAFLRVEAEEDKKVYPEIEDSAMVLALGDPHTSPVWTAAASQMEVGEKARFQINKKLIDFDPEGLNPTESCSTWVVELLRIVEVEDIHQDFMQLLHVEHSGGTDRVEELDAVALHWRVRRWMAEGCPCIGSSRERIAIMPGWGLVPIEDPNAPPTGIRYGENQQEAIELVVARVGPGGRGHMYLKSEALTDNRPGGCVIMDVELVAIERSRGPGSEGWRGWQSIMAEREAGDEWLNAADTDRTRLETFSTLRKSTDDSKGAEAHVAEKVHKSARNAMRRYRRALRWGEDEGAGDRKIVLERATIGCRLAKAQALSHQRFGDAAEAAPSEEEKKALQEAQELLSSVLATGEELKNDSIVFEALRIRLQILIQSEEAAEAKQVLERLSTMKPEDADLKSESVRIHRLESALSLKRGANTVETVQKDLQAAVTANDKAAAGTALTTLLDLMKSNQVTWDVIRTCKVGKDVGNAMKMGDADLATQARKVVQEIQALAQRNGLGL